MARERTDRIDRVARALGDPSRRRLLERLADQPGQTTGELEAAVRQLSRWGVLKHLAVLRDAGLIETLPEGRRRRHYLNASELYAVAEWLSSLQERSGRRP